MNIYEKVGDFTLNLVSIVIGGILFAAIMSKETYPAGLYIFSSVSAAAFFVFALILYRKGKKNT